MARIREAATLDDLWALIPTVDGCDGYCASSCGPIAYTPEEAKRIKAAGANIANRADEGIDRLPVVAKEARMCPALTEDKRCSIYEARPTICRLWGSAKPLQCLGPNCHIPFPLTVEEGMVVLYRSEELGGGRPLPARFYQRLHAGIVKAEKTAPQSRSAGWGLPAFGKP